VFPIFHTDQWWLQTTNRKSHKVHDRVLNLHLSGCEVATALDSAVHQLPVISCSLSSTHTNGDYRPLIGSHTRCMTVLNLHLSGCEVATALDSAVHQLLKFCWRLRAMLVICVHYLLRSATQSEQAATIMVARGRITAALLQPTLSLLTAVRLPCK